MNEAETVLYREEVGELAVKELLQLALVEFVFVSVVSRVVVENCYQRIHRTLELSGHSAERTGTRRRRFRGEMTENRSGDVWRDALTWLESHASVAKRRGAACLSVIEEKLSLPSSLRG